MPKFCCKHCGMITDNPEILPDTYAYNRAKSARKSLSIPTKDLKPDYFIICPVCLGRTDFTRPEPFPTDKNDEIDVSTIPSRVA